MKKSMPLFSACLILVVGLLSMDLYNPSLPEITRALSISQSLTRAMILFYLLGIGLSQLVYGPLSDRYGRKVIIIIGLTVCAAGNLLGAFAHSGVELSIYRFITGLGVGGVTVVCRAIICDVYQDHKALSRAFSIFATMSQLSPAFAPVIGGFMVHYFGWQSNFILLSVLTLSSLFIVLWTYKESLYAPMCLSPRKVLEGYLKVCTRNFVIYSAMAAINFSIILSYYSIGPYIIQDGFHLTAVDNGLIFLLYPMGLVIGTFIFRALNTRNLSNQHIINICGFLFTTVSLIMLGASLLVDNLWVMLAGMGGISIITGMAAAPFMSSSLAKAGEHKGSASALQGTLKMLGTALGLLIFLHLHITTVWPLAFIMLIFSFFLLLLNWGLDKKSF